jgi:hypothetical protein
MLGVSPSTVRRWVKEGRLRSQKVTTPQGYVFRVHLPAEPAPAPAAAPAMEDVKAGAPAPSAEPAVALSMERAGAMAVYNASLIAPLVAELSETRVRLVAQAEEVGSLRAQLAAANERIRMLESPEPEPTPIPEPTPPGPDGREPQGWWARVIAWLAPA